MRCKHRVMTLGVRPIPNNKTYPKLGLEGVTPGLQPLQLRILARNCLRQPAGLPRHGRLVGGCGMGRDNGCVVSMRSVHLHCRGLVLENWPTEAVVAGSYSTKPY